MEKRNFIFRFVLQMVTAAVKNAIQLHKAGCVAPPTAAPPALCPRGPGRLSSSSPKLSRIIRCVSGRLRLWSGLARISESVSAAVIAQHLSERAPTAVGIHVDLVGSTVMLDASIINVIPMRPVPAAKISSLP